MIQIYKLEKDNPKHCKQLIPQVANVEQQVQGGYAWSRKTLDELLQSEYQDLLMVSSDEISKPVVAFCLYKVMFETAEILRMGTHPRWQRQGIAHKLLNQLLSELPTEVETVLLEVRADNIPAINLYHRKGFEQIDTRKGYYKQTDGSSVDALIMKKELSHKG